MDSVNRKLLDTASNVRVLVVGDTIAGSLLVG